MSSTFCQAVSSAVRYHLCPDWRSFMANNPAAQRGGRHVSGAGDGLHSLAAASKSCANDHEDWFAIQKKRMKSNRVKEVLAELVNHQEPSSVEDKDAPVRACLRYMKNRPDQLDYAKALQKELPIGSGEIESAHRYVIQERLKISGAWWKIENADKMLALRLTRANGNWEKYWNSIQAAK